MAKKRFLVVEDSFIGMQLIRAEDKKVVEIETDPKKGGMIPAQNLVEVDENDQPVTSSRRAAAPAPAPASEPTGEATDLA